MTHFVAEPCFDCKYSDCIVVCPLNCFYQWKASSAFGRKDVSEVTSSRCNQSKHPKCPDPPEIRNRKWSSRK